MQQHTRKIMVPFMNEHFMMRKEFISGVARIRLHEPVLISLNQNQLKSICSSLEAQASNLPESWGWGESCGNLPCRPGESKDDWKGGFDIEGGQWVNGILD